MKTKLLIVVDDKMAKRLRKMARKEGISVSHLIRIAITHMFNGCAVKPTTIGELAEHGLLE